MKIAVLILAAGSSSRMGRPKQLLSVNDTTLLGLAIANALDSKADKAYCVLGANSEVISKSIENFGIESITNQNFQDGLSSSIVSGISHLEQCNYDAVLITLGDQPYVDAEFLNRMIDKFKKNPNHIIASSYIGNNGVPAVFPKRYFDNLKKLKGDRGAKKLLNDANNPIIAIETNKIEDIDTPEDYKKLLNK